MFLKRKNMRTVIIPEWKIATATIQGLSHIKSNTPCQDKTFYYKNQKTNFYMIALADGAGSCEYSHFGAEIVTQEICYLLEEKFDLYYQMKTNPAEQIIDFLNKRLLIKATKLKAPIKSLSSTLMFVCIKDDKVIIGHLGDGTVFKLNNQNQLGLISNGENGEFANSTFFVTSTNVAKHLYLIKGNLKDNIGFGLMSDGSASSLYNKKDKLLSKVLLTFFQWLDEYNEEEVQNALQKNIEIIQNKTTDDCSLALIKCIFHKIDISDEPTFLDKYYLFKKYRYIFKHKTTSKKRFIELISKI